MAVEHRAAARAAARASRARRSASPRRGSAASVRPTSARRIQAGSGRSCSIGRTPLSSGLRARRVSVGIASARAEVDPADHALDHAVAALRDVEQVARLRHRRRRLHQHRRRRRPRARAAARRSFERKVAMDRREVRREPAVVAARERPDVVMGVDVAGHRMLGDGQGRGVPATRRALAQLDPESRRESEIVAWPRDRPARQRCARPRAPRRRRMRGGNCSAAARSGTSMARAHVLDGGDARHDRLRCRGVVEVRLPARRAVARRSRGCPS